MSTVEPATAPGREQRLLDAGALEPVGQIADRLVVG
jgi:hypothetical protein